MIEDIEHEDSLDEHEPVETYISAETRRLVLERDNWRCRRCGQEDLDKLTLHHVVYRSQGGKHGPDNLVTLCWVPCHKMIHDGKLKVANINGNWFFSERGNWMTDYRLA